MFLEFYINGIIRRVSFFSMFIFIFESEREREREPAREGQREKGTEDLKQAPRSQ